MEFDGVAGRFTLETYISEYIEERKKKNSIKFETILKIITMHLTVTLLQPLML